MSETSEPSASSVPAGWLADPGNPALLRYWDGQQWTDQTAPAPGAVPAPPVAGQTQIISDKSGKPIQATTAWILAIVTLGYMVPWAIAATRGKANAGAIGWLNLLLGWTLIGWIVALVMACSSHQKFAITR